MQCYRLNFLFSGYWYFRSIKTGSCTQVLKEPNLALELHVADPWSRPSETLDLYQLLVCPWIVKYTLLCFCAKYGQVSQSLSYYLNGEAAVRDTTWRAYLLIWELPTNFGKQKLSQGWRDVTQKCTWLGKDTWNKGHLLHSSHVNM